MAAFTITSVGVNVGPIRGDIPGLNVKHAKLTWSTDISSTLSVSVCVQMIALPQGARLLDLVTQVTGQTGQVGSYAIGDGSSTARFCAAISLTASTVVNRMTGTGLDYRISVTESDFLTFDTLDMTFGANVTSTRTLCVDMVAYYIMDRQNTGEV